VTVLNTWPSQRSANDEAGREAYVQCDFCRPPELAFGTPISTAHEGWSFKDFDAGPHRCFRCAKLPAAKRVQRWRETRRPALPNLIIIGAARSGTSALHHYLGLHPEIFMSEIKELKFFQDPGCLESLDSYSTCFDGAAPVRGEATPIYTCHPLLPGVPERISAAIPDAKLIYLVRDPVERAVATYHTAAAMEFETASIDDAFLHPEDPFNVYMAESRYATQYEQFARSFPREQLLVIRQADLLDRRMETLRRVFRFLDVDSTFVSSGFQDLINPRPSQRRTALGKSLRTTPLTRALWSLPPGVREALLRPPRRLFSARFVRQAPSEELRRRLFRVLQPEVERFRELTGVSVESRAP
jgi:hypothetical protein